MRALSRAATVHALAATQPALAQAAPPRRLPVLLATPLPRCWRVARVRVHEAHKLLSPRGDLAAAGAAIGGASHVARLPLALLQPLQPSPAAAYAHGC